MVKTDTSALSNNLEVLKVNNSSNNAAVAVDFQSTKNGNIVFTCKEILKLCKDIGETKKFIVNRLELAHKRMDSLPEPRNYPKGWLIKAITDNYDLNPCTVTKQTEKEVPSSTEGTAEQEDQASKERNEREARATKADIIAAKKATLKNPEAQKFFNLVDKIKNKPSIDMIIQDENVTRKVELHKQRTTVLTKKMIADVVG